MRIGVRHRRALSVAFICIAIAWPHRISARTPAGSAEVRLEIARGASTVAAITVKKFPRETTYRLMRASLEKNVQARRDSDGFAIGAHLVIAVWLMALPNDVGWREKALARHRDVAGWILPRLGLPVEDIQSITAQAAKLTPAQRDYLREIVRNLTGDRARSVH